MQPEMFDSELPSSWKRKDWKFKTSFSETSVSSSPLRTFLEVRPLRLVLMGHRIMMSTTVELEPKQRESDKARMCSEVFDNALPSSQEMKDRNFRTSFSETSMYSLFLTNFWKFFVIMVQTSNRICPTKMSWWEHNTTCYCKHLVREPANTWLENPHVYCEGFQGSPFQQNNEEELTRLAFLGSEPCLHDDDLVWDSCSSYGSHFNNWPSDCNVVSEMTYKTLRELPLSC